MSPLDLSIAVLAAAAAGAVNALAGGGTLISFPVLLALGVPPIAANVTNAVALSPGYLGATLAQLGNLRGQRERLLSCIPAAVIGGLAGAVVLLNTHERTFLALVPYMLFFAALLLAFQNRVRTWVLRRLTESRHAHRGRLVPAIAVGAAGVYGGFFTAGMSVIVLAILGATVEDSLTRLNALKQIAAFSVNMAAVMFFLFSGQVIWLLAGAMAAGALIGGALGGRFAGRMNPDTLRWIVVTVGVMLAIVYWFRD
jgi:uncharacterized membrane protein YfcA